MNVLAKLDAAQGNGVWCVDDHVRVSSDDRLSDDARAYLARVHSRGWLRDIRQAFDAADKLNILFVGETIIDEYRYVNALAKPSKEFILATVEARAPESFLGGVVAASLHGDWPHVSVVTNDGEPLKKTRFVDADFGRKLFEVYSKPRIELDAPQRITFQGKMLRGMKAADVVVVMDFGHGLLRQTERALLTRDAKFLAVNAQTNAGNHGFNPVTNYERPHLTCVDLPEAQLAGCMQDETDPEILTQQIRGLSHRNHIIITHGRQGCYCPQHVPAFASRTLDTMGAGDAFLAVTAPLVAAGLDLECAAFVGNVAGAIKTDIVGHRRHVERGELMHRIGELLA